MVNTRNTTIVHEPILPNLNPDSSRVSPPFSDSINPSSHEQLLQHLSIIMAKLSCLDSDVSKLKRQKVQSSSSEIPMENARTMHDKTKDNKHDSPWWSIKNHNKRPNFEVEFPKFQGGDLLGWFMEAEKYFRYYHQTPEELKVDVATMNLGGDALDVFIWVSSGTTIRSWKDSKRGFQENLGPAEFQNPDVYLCSIKQVGSVHEYRKEFARRSSIVHGWPEHCLLGVFINGLKEELKSDVKIHKPCTVKEATSLALEFESILQNQGVIVSGQCSGWACGSENFLNYRRK